MVKGVMYKKAQKYLLWNLQDALEILNGQKESFKEKFGEPMTFTKFYQFIKKKKEFISQRDILDTSCLCEIYDNASLGAKAIRKEKEGHPTAPRDLVEKYLCDSSNANCISDRCRECSTIKILSGWDEASSSESSREGLSSSDEEFDKITHTQWTRVDGKMKKKLLNM